MLEWLCPRCERAVHPALQRCPWCEEADAARAEGRAERPVSVRRQAFWADFNRGVNFALGFVAVLALVYFLLFLIAYYGGYPEWVERMARWIRPG
jgi:hypothetical protein